MSKELVIYIRKDLNMRKGKMAAQSAHAAMKILLDAMEKTEDSFTLKANQTKDFNEWLKNPVVRIKMVKDEDELNSALDKSKPYTIIQDSGRTEFHGVKTVTCAAQGIFDEFPFEGLEVRSIYGSDIKSKQVIVFTKEAPLAKEIACELAALSCLLNLSKKMKNVNNTKLLDFKNEKALKDWVLNAFAKIAVSLNTKAELKSLENELWVNRVYSEIVSKGDNYCLCIEPQHPEIIDFYTKSLKLI